MTPVVIVPARSRRTQTQRLTVLAINEVVRTGCVGDCFYWFPTHPVRTRTVPEDPYVQIVLDNVSTHKTPEIQRWLRRHRRFTFHFTPTYSSWMNLVERWFAEFTNKWLKRGTHHSVRNFTASIRTWTENWNDDPKSFVWHKTANEILDTLAAYCQRISDSVH